MNGTWYVIKKVATTSTCMSVIYNNTANYMEMREIRTPASITPFNIILTNIGKLTQKGNNPAVMNLKWESKCSVGAMWVSLSSVFRCICMWRFCMYVMDLHKNTYV